MFCSTGLPFQFPVEGGTDAVSDLAGPFLTAGSAGLRTPYEYAISRVFNLLGVLVRPGNRRGT